MKKPKLPIEIEVWKTPSGVPQSNFIIDCSDLIDWYSYHDAPISITWYPTREELIKLQELIDVALQKYDEPRG